MYSLNVIDVASLLCKTRSTNDFVAVSVTVSLNNGSKIHVTGPVFYSIRVWWAVTYWFVPDL